MSVCVAAAEIIESTTFRASSVFFGFLLRPGSCFHQQIDDHITLSLKCRVSVSTMDDGGAMELEY